MRVLGTCVNVQVVDELVTKTSLRKHSADGTPDEFGGSGCEDLLGGGEALAARVTGVTDIDAVGHLLAGKTDLVGVDDDHVVAAVHMRGEAGLVLAAEHEGDAGSQATQDEVGW